tara:strand:- start:754 stop:972 length:219 start_codon:yes stop_codon:yes gene_type:complete
MAKLKAKQLSSNLFSGSLAVTGSMIISGSDNPAAGKYILTTSGSINTTSGRVFEKGTSVVDHATAMSIVFGG